MKFSFRLNLYSIGTLAAVALTLSFFAGCERPQGPMAAPITFDEEGVPDAPMKFDAIPTLPVRRVLTDVEGRSVEVDILKRTAAHVTVLRVSDTKEFQLPFNRLSEADQAFVSRLPLSAPPATPKTEKAPEAESPQTQTRTQSHQAWIEVADAMAFRPGKRNGVL